ncbi:succinylglutamate desuccinylase [Halomonas sp. HNIBRBA4712]|uniref:succinylglutamate desuccinylase n=1 Tax=Halomonas sp. HNIBRBA4712 TaxID=3373087 RepID=UPI0037473696
MLSHWLEWTLDDKTPSRRTGTFASGAYQLIAPGVLALTPEDISDNARACVFSAAIHGNETAPVELLGQWLCALEAGAAKLHAPVLVILGNIPALKAQTRFVETNLNRLFERGLDRQGFEADRARELMQIVDAFFERYAALPRLHYDLHTAIRQSRYPRFVVEPFSTTVTEAEQWAWLAGADMQAILHQHQPSFTFSHYSRHYHQAQAFTFELGRVAPFGQNDLAALAPMGALLAALGAGETPQSGGALPHFRVEHELKRQNEAFTLCFDEDVSNFTRFEPGTVLARDGEAGDFTVGSTPLHVVFPNAHVELGARAALLVVPADDAAPA